MGSRNLLTNLMKRLKCTRDNWKKKNPHSTNSDQEKECLPLPLPAQKNLPMFRKPRLSSRKPSTKSMSQEVLQAPWPFPQVHLQNSHPLPPFSHQETCVLDQFMLPVLAELDL